MDGCSSNLTLGGTLGPITHEKNPGLRARTIILACLGSVTGEGSGWSLRRPRDLTGATVGQIGDLARASCGDSGFDRCVWLFAALDAVEKVLHVRNGAVAETLCLDDRIVF